MNGSYLNFWQICLDVAILTGPVGLIVYTKYITA